MLGVALFALFAIRLWDGRADRLEWKRLAALQPQNPGIYDPVMVADLPEPARRFFNFAIRPGTSLLTVAEIDMSGQFSLGTVSGSDSGRWTRFRIFGLFPVARMGGNPDHSRAAYGRYVAEALFWTPAALLTGPGVVWEKVDENTARVIVSHMGFSQAVDLKVDGDGRPVEVHFMRWSDSNPEKTYRLQPFGGKMSDFREVQGFRLPLTSIKDIFRQDQSMEEIARRMFLRWNQENYFKYMREEYNLDHLVSRDVEPADMERLIPNPQKKALRKEREKKLRQLKTEKERYATKAADNNEKQCRTVRGFNISNYGLKTEIKWIEVKSRRLMIKSGRCRTK